MNTRIRQALAIVAFSTVAAAAGITGATLRAETKQTTVAEACATAHWPNIPAACLEGGADRDVRIIADQSIEFRQVAAVSLNERFAVAFQ